MSPSLVCCYCNSIVVRRSSRHQWNAYVMRLYTLSTMSVDIVLTARRLLRSVAIKVHYRTSSYTVSSSKSCSDAKSAKSCWIPYSVNPDKSSGLSTGSFYFALTAASIITTPTSSIISAQLVNFISYFFSDPLLVWCKSPWSSSHQLDSQVCDITGRD